MLLDPVPHRCTEGHHRQRRALGGDADFLDHGGLVVGEVAVDGFQGAAGVGRRGNRGDVDDGLVTRCLILGDTVVGQELGPAIGGGRLQVVLGLGQRVIRREVQQFDALAVVQGQAQRQEQVPVVGPFTVGIQFGGAFVGQFASVEQLLQRFVITVRHAAEVGIELAGVGFHRHLGVGVAVTLHALVQIVLGGLFQGPGAKADDIAIVGIGEKLGDAFLTAQFHFDIGVGEGAQGECG